MLDILHFEKIIVLILFLFLFFILLFIFLFTRRPITKIIVLSFAYNIILFFIICNVNMFNVEDSTIDFIILIIFSCLLSVLSGIFIINNIIKNNAR